MAKKSKVKYSEMVAVAITALEKTDVTPCLQVLVKYIMDKNEISDDQAFVRKFVKMECEERRITAAEEKQCGFLSPELAEENAWVRETSPEAAGNSELFAAAMKANQPVAQKPAKKAKNTKKE